MATRLQEYRSSKDIYKDILRLFKLIKDPTQTHFIEIRDPILFELFNKYLEYFNKSDPSEKDRFSQIDNDLFDYLNNKGHILANFPDILNPKKPKVQISKLRVPVLSERLIKGDAKQINFFGSDQPFEILPTETIIINLDKDNILRHATSLDKIEIYKLANGKYVIQQISEVSCAISSLAMLYTDNGLNINDPLFFKLLTYSLTGTGCHFGTSCEQQDKIISIIGLTIPGKYLLHEYFNSSNFEYDVAYFQELIKLYGSVVIHVNFDDSQDGGHVAVLDSIDMNHAIIREPYHGYAFKISTRLLLEKKIAKERGNYKFTYLSNQKYSGALTDREEEYRIANAKKKYLKYKTKYLQLKNKI